MCREGIVMRIKNRVTQKVCTLIVLTTLCIFAFSVFTSCTKIPSQIYEGFSNSLVSMANKSWQEMNMETTLLTKTVKDESYKLAKLEQVGNAANYWLDIMKVQADKELWSPRVVSVTKDLVIFKNDRYEIIKLEFIVLPSSTRQYSSTVTVLDAYDNKQYPYKDLHDELALKVKEYSSRANEKLDTQIKSIDTVSSVLSKSDSWKVAKLNSSSYKFSGPALGWSGSTETSGMWTYDTNNNAVTAVDAGSVALEKLIKGK
jgi:hypothetical protein